MEELTINYNEQMLNYYPEVIKSIREFQALIATQSLQVDELHEELTKVLSNAYVKTADEQRLSEWERVLGITPSPQGEDDIETWLSDRRDTVLARVFQTKKLNTHSIADIVKIFTGGGSESWVLDGTLYVKIYPSENNKQFSLDRVIEALKLNCPAHLNLFVYVDYITWERIYNTLTWNDISTKFNDWREVKGDYSKVDIFEYIVDEDGGFITDESNSRLFN